MRHTGGNIMVDPYFVEAAASPPGPHYNETQLDMTFEATGSGEIGGVGPRLVMVAPASQRGICQERLTPCRVGDVFYARIRYRSTATTLGNGFRFEIEERQQDTTLNNQWPDMIDANAMTHDNTWRWATGSAAVSQSDTTWVRPCFTIFTSFTAGQIEISYAAVYGGALGALRHDDAVLRHRNAGISSAWTTPRVRHLNERI